MEKIKDRNLFPGLFKICLQNFYMNLLWEMQKKNRALDDKQTHSTKSLSVLT